MKRIIIFSLIIFVAVVFLYKIGCTQPNKDTLVGSDVGDKVENFTLSAFKGPNVSLSDYIGKNVILLVFSTTWCPSCNKEIPELKKLHDEYDDKGLKIIDIFVQEGKNKVSPVVKRNKIPYTVLLDVDGEVTRDFRVRGVPTLMLIDADGIIRRRGYPPSSRFIPLIEDLLKDVELEEVEKKKEE